MNRRAALALALALPALPAAPPDRASVVRLADEVELRFVWLPPGSYWRGSDPAEAGRDADEGPRHEVTLTRGFYLGTHEVTQAQWAAVLGRNPAVFRRGPDAPQRPVESVSWNDDQAGYATHAYAWANSRSLAITHPVGTRPPNAWGLHDLHGNVWEWCADWYGPYAAGPQSDPAEPAEGRERVFRGGSWYDFPPSLRSAGHSRGRKLHWGTVAEGTVRRWVTSPRGETSSLTLRDGQFEFTERGR